jgi:hypothetical protein
MNFIYVSRERNKVSLGGGLLGLGVIVGMMYVNDGLPASSPEWFEGRPFTSYIQNADGPSNVRPSFVSTRERSSQGEEDDVETLEGMPF